MRLCVFILVLLPLSLTGQKIQGLSFVAAPEAVDSNDVKPMVEVNANWVAITPYGYIKDGKVVYNSKWQWYGEKTKGAKEAIQLCKDQGLKVMVKPQIWIHNGYTGDFALDSEKQWIEFEHSYLDFIVEFLAVAKELEAEMFCVGTEWREFVKARPNFWGSLIDAVSETYSGDITYAANWDDFDDVPFWDQLDYIGVDAYFPICLSTNAKLKEMCVSWKEHCKTLKAFSKEQGKKILFTEFGYRSLKGTTRNPWVADTNGKFDEDEQSDGFKSIFQEVWNQEWFAGGFIWKWFNNHESNGGEKHLGFTPQNKLAEETIRKFWAK